MFMQNIGAECLNANLIFSYVNHAGFDNAKPAVGGWMMAPVSVCKPNWNCGSHHMCCYWSHLFFVMQGSAL